MIMAMHWNRRIGRNHRPPNLYLVIVELLDSLYWRWRLLGSHHRYA
jgi:hypothetical protein